MRYRELKPCAALAPYIKCIWLLENDSPSSALEAVLPDACPELIIHYADKFRIKGEDGRITTQPRSFFFGPLTRHIQIGPSGKTGMIAARFYPGAAAAFLAQPISGLTNRYESLRQLFGQAGGALETEICKAATFNERKKVLERFLLGLLPAHHDAVAALSHKVLELISNREVPVKISQLSKSLHIGTRHLERKFTSSVGMSPKMLLRIIRFQNIFKIIRQKKIKNLTELTYEAGYYDQSHFNRDFKQFAGQRPKDYFKEDAALAKLFTSGE
jgi:AraC-like DNA-binding protein